MEREQLVRTVTAAQKGDGEALNELFNAYYNDVYYYALKTVRNEDLAVEITQDTFVEIIETLEKLRVPEAFVTWMIKITYHQCTKYFKKRDRAKEHGLEVIAMEEDQAANDFYNSRVEDHGEFIPDEALDQKDFRETIMAMVDKLSEEQRAAVMMYYFDEMSVRDIAEIQGVSEGTVKSRLNYARKAIKTSVEEYEKKNNIKLHSVAFLPLLRWLFDGFFEKTMPFATAEQLAGSVAAVTGTSVALSSGVATTATAVGTAATSTSVVTAATTTTATAATSIGAKIAALPIVTKVVSGVLAASIVVGGGAVVVLDQDNEVLDVLPSPSPIVSVAPSVEPTLVPTPVISATPSAPTATSTPEVSDAPSAEPTPVSDVTAEPTASVSEAPQETVEPTVTPTPYIDETFVYYVKFNSAEDAIWGYYGQLSSTDPVYFNSPDELSVNDAVRLSYGFVKGRDGETGELQKSYSGWYWNYMFQRIFGRTFDLTTLTNECAIYDSETDTMTLTFDEPAFVASTYEQSEVTQNTDGTYSSTFYLYDYVDGVGRVFRCGFTITVMSMGEGCWIWESTTEAVAPSPEPVEYPTSYLDFSSAEDAMLSYTSQLSAEQAYFESVEDVTADMAVRFTYGYWGGYDATGEMVRTATGAYINAICQRVFGKTFDWTALTGQCATYNGASDSITVTFGNPYTGGGIGEYTAIFQNADGSYSRTYYSYSTPVNAPPEEGDYTTVETETGVEYYLFTYRGTLTIMQVGDSWILRSYTDEDIG